MVGWVMTWGVDMGHVKGVKNEPCPVHPFHIHTPPSLPLYISFLFCTAQVGLLSVFPPTLHMFSFLCGQVGQSAVPAIAGALNLLRADVDVLAGKFSAQV